MKVELYQGLLEINWNLLFSAITVLVLYLILKHFFFEKVHKFMVARQEAVQKELDDASRRKMMLTQCLQITKKRCPVQKKKRERL